MPGTRVFVGGLKNPRLREKDLEKFFEGKKNYEVGKIFGDLR